MGGAMNKRKVCSRILVFSVLFSLIAVIPQEISAQSKKGMELFNSWKFQEAEKVFREDLKANPSDTPTNFYLGLSLLLQEEHSDALDVFLKVKSSQDRADQRTRPAVPSEFQIQLALARARLGLKQYDESWKNLESARIEDARSSDVYVYRGVFYLQQKKIGEALEELQKAIKLDAKNPYAYYYEGLAYHQASEAVKAVEALRMFIKLAPDAPEAGKAKPLIDQLC
jgi:tetratricopeptide (TPR) repeat protein